MPHFVLRDHPQLPVCTASVETGAPKHVTKDGFRTRYQVRVADEAHADAVVSLLDDALRPRTKGHGVYQCPYDDLRAQYGLLLGDTRRRLTFGRALLKASACALAAWLLVAMIFLSIPATLLFLLFAAVRRQSGFAAMFEASMLWSLLDWRPLIVRLLDYAKYR